MCSCGSVALECPFWGSILRRALHDSGYANFHEANSAVRTLERSRRWMAFGRGNLEDSARWSVYADFTRGVLRGVVAKSGCETIIDSSNVPIRAGLLSKVLGVDRVTVIHLVRDARGFAESRARSFRPDPTQGIERSIKGKSKVNSAGVWCFRNAECEWLARVLPRNSVVRVRFEDVLQGPRALPLALRPEGMTWSIGSSVPGPPHMLAGNRLRMQDTIRIRVASESPPRSTPLALVPALPLMIRYEYLLRRSQ